MKRVLILVSPIIILLFWFIVSGLKIIKPIFLPSPIEVFNEFIDLIKTAILFKDLFPTIMRWILGMIIGLFFGVPIGLLMGSSEKIYTSLEVVVDFFRSIPVMTLFPLFLVFFGLGDVSKIAISSWGAFLFILINTLYGVKHSRETRLMVAKTLKANKIQTFRKIIFPGALPEIFVGIRIALSISLIVVVAAEMLMGTKMGIGKRIYDSALVYDMSKMYVYIGVAGLLGYLSNKIFFLIENKLIHWSGK